MARTGHTTMRLTDRDRELLDMIQDREALVSRTEALRYALRYWARREAPMPTTTPARKRKP